MMRALDMENPGAAATVTGVQIATATQASSLRSTGANRFRPESHQGRRIAFERIAWAALGNAARIVPAMLPHGRREGREWVALNPRRADRHLGSFRVRLDTGRWADFALPNARGGDLISLLAYLADLPMRDAALSLAGLIGVDSWEARDHG
jgi:hypothetical protein